MAPVTATQPDSFRYQRSPSGFEDVMTYYHVDRSERMLDTARRPYFLWDVDLTLERFDALLRDPDADTRAYALGS